MSIYLAVAFDVALVGLGIGLLGVLIRRRRGALKSSRDIQYLEQQLDRALEQINSSDEDDILAGCQTLTIFNDTRSRIKALKRVRALMGNQNALVARQAGMTYSIIMEGLERAAGGSAKS